MDSSIVCYSIYNLLFEFFEGVSRGDGNLSRFLENRSKNVLATQQTLRTYINDYTRVKEASQNTGFDQSRVLHQWVNRILTLDQIEQNFGKEIRS